MGFHVESPTKFFGAHFACFVATLLLLVSNMQCHAHLSPTFYDKTCPTALTTIRTAIRTAISRERRMAASLIRLHFHDCFVQVLTERTSSSIPFVFALLFFFYQLLLWSIWLDCLVGRDFVLRHCDGSAGLWCVHLVRSFFIFYERKECAPELPIGKRVWSHW